MEKTRKFLGGSGSMPPRKKFEIWASETFSIILEQKFEFLDRTQISLNFSFFIQWLST